MTKLLLVDDDLTIGPLVKEYLEAHDFHCVLCHNAYDGLRVFKEDAFDLCILDVVMPMMNGLELADHFISLNSNIPFLFLTSQGSLNDRVKGLEMGADDYILKPFSMKELLLRIQTILKRTVKKSNIQLVNKVYDIGRFTFHATSRELKIDDQTISLSAIEAQLLQLFCESNDGIVLRDKALSAIWSDEYSFKTRSLNVYVSRLRKYFLLDKSISIKNIHGKGYQLIQKLS